MDPGIKPLIVVQLTIQRPVLERLYDELARLPKRARAGHIRYALNLVSEGKYVARVDSAPTPANTCDPIVVKVQFKSNDREYSELEALGPLLRAGPLRAKLLLYCQGAVLVDAGSMVAAHPVRSENTPNADEDIAQAFGIAVEPLQASQ